MSRTIRIYNSKHWKWHAEHEIEFFNRDYEWLYTGTDDTMIPGVIVRIVKKKYNPSTWEWRYRHNGFVYHPYKQLCMGCCSYDYVREKAHRLQRWDESRHIITNREYYISAINIRY